MSESGGTRRVGASGVGTPRGESTVTSASPMPSDVIVVPASKKSVIGKVRTVFLQVVGVLRREDAQRVLDAVAELGEDRRRDVGRGPG